MAVELLVNGKATGNYRYAETGRGRLYLKLLVANGKAKVIYLPR